MKIKTLFYTTLFLLATTSLFAAQKTLSWNPNSESDLAGYKVYYGKTSKDDAGFVEYDTVKDVGNVTSHIVIDLIEGDTYFFAATAYDFSGNESGYSSEASYDVLDVAPVPPTGLTLSGVNTLTWERGDMVSHYNVYKNDLFDGRTSIERYRIYGANKEIQTWNITTVNTNLRESVFSRDFKVKIFGWKARKI